jgi:TonB family protein
MSLAVFYTLVVISVACLVSIFRRYGFASTILKVSPVLALAFLAFTVAPLHAQSAERPAIHKVPPVYPPIARQMGLTGTITVTTTVDPTGKVIKAESTSGSKVFLSAAIDAVKQWKFAPGATTDTFPVTINFEKN